MNTEGLTEVAVKEAQPVVEQITETPPELEPAPPAPVAETAVAVPATGAGGAGSSSGGVSVICSTTG